LENREKQVELLAISVAEAGKALGLGRNAAYAAAKRGLIPTKRIGRRLVVPLAPLKRMLEADLPTRPVT